MSSQQSIQYKSSSGNIAGFKSGGGFAITGFPRGGYEGRERARSMSPVGILSIGAARSQARQLEARLRKYREPRFTFAQISQISSRKQMLEVLKQLREEAAQKNV